MAQWNVETRTNKTHNGGFEETTYEATVHLVGDDPDDTVELSQLITVIDGLTTDEGIPDTAKLGNTIDFALRWTEADLPP